MIFLNENSSSSRYQLARLNKNYCDKFTMLKNSILKEKKFITVNLINFYFTRNLNVLKKKKILTETIRLGTYFT